MADNLAVTPGSGATMAADELTINATLVKVPRAKIVSGADGVYEGDVSSALGLPIRTASLIAPATGTLTRVADTNAYATGDFVANSTTAASCTISNSGFTIPAARGNDIPGRLTKCILKMSGATVTNAVFRVHLFNSDPLSSAPANGDNGLFNPANKANYLGRFDVTVNQVFGDGSVGFGSSTEGNYVDFTPATGTSNIFALLEVRAAFTPTSAEVFTLTLITE